MNDNRFILRSSLQPELVSDDPDGWDSVTTVFSRGKRFSGIFQTFQTGVKFFGDARTWLEDVLFAGGVQADAKCLVQVKDCDSRKFRTEFVGRINLADPGLKITDTFAEVTLEEVNPAQDIKNRASVEYDMALLTTAEGLVLTPETDDFIEAGMHSRAIPLKYAAQNAALQIINNPSIVTNISAGSNIVNREIIRYVQFGFQDIQFEELNDIFTYPNAITSVQPAEIYDVTVAGDHNFSVSIRLDLNIEASNQSAIEAKVVGCTRGDGVWGEFRFQIFYEVDRFGGGTDTTIIFDTGNQTGCGQSIFNEVLNFSFNVADTYAVGDTVSLYGRMRFFSQFDESLFGGSTINTDIQGVFYGQTKININGLTTFTATTANGKLIFETWKRLFQHILNRQDSFESEFYGRTDSNPSYDEDGQASIRMITNGAQIRQLPLADRPIFVSLDDLFDNCNALDNIGLGLFVGSQGQTIVRAEPKEFFYQRRDIMLDLGNVSNLEILVDLESIFNTISVGYELWEIEDTQGLDEQNSKRQYANLITQTGGDLDLISSYLGGGYRIEKQRRLQPDPDTDGEDDANNFFVVLRRDGMDYEAARNQDYAVVGNIQDPDSVYNLDISPRRMLQRWLNVIAVSVQNMVNGDTNFQSGEGNFTAFTRKTGETTQLGENDNLTFGILPAPLYFPFLYRFEYTFSMADLEAIKSNPYREVRFLTRKDVPLYGFLEEIQIERDKDEAFFELKRSR